MDDTQPEVEMDRMQAMLLMYAQGYRFAAMVPVLVNFGLLNCQEGHRKRPAGDKTACATCENTILVSWRRHMKAIGATRADLDEVRGAWFTAHATVEQICSERYKQDVVITTTRTERVGDVDVITTTERHETVIHVGLLRLWCDVRDKMARMSGVNVKNPPSARKIARRLLAVTERTNEPDEHGDGRAN